MNNTIQTKKLLQKAITDFASKPLLEAAEDFWNILGYKSNHILSQRSYTFDDFSQNFGQKHEIRAEKALKEDWEQAHILFQLTDEEISHALESQSQMQIPGSDSKSVQFSNLSSYLMMAVELKQDNYSRTKLTNLTREINRCLLIPVLLLIKTASKLHIAVIFRRRNKQDQNKDVLEKVTIIKDVDISQTHRAHLDILLMLSLPALHQKYQLQNFDQLHNAWQKSLDIQELNKRFYSELSNWFFWALEKVHFPDDSIKNEEERNSIGLIRLLTRFIFVWFMKEKQLIPEQLFDPHAIAKIIKKEDPNDSNYYKAILQNLFFATLNCDPQQEPAKGRRFRTKINNHYYNEHFNVFNVFRYEKLFQEPETVISRYFSQIPFLNGGLFECLDSDERTQTKIIKIYKDGFSDRNDNPIKVPDALFLQESEISCDLNDYYGSKNKIYKTKGLLEILHSYKFTIAENTPIEEEVALDPELLGRVFENLLAAFNPETKESARKQTGSYYTPREVVDFMVNEAIINHLLSSFERLSPEKKENLEERLRSMMRYSEKDYSFDASEVDLLINAIDNTKILDPACGSGAFPMGLLLKMVYILHIIDPQNQKWKQRQIDNLKTASQKMQESITDSKIKDEMQSKLEKSIQEIQRTFQENDLDYSRKLFLIERCIYGADIQSIAIQISQLRFFISLLVDQVPDKNKENQGIQSLPNLETNFVAANSLIPINIEQQLDIFGSKAVDKFVKDISAIHSKYFNIHNRTDKRKLQKKEAELRKDFAIQIKGMGAPTKEADLIANWNPYQRDKTADFFHPLFMFGVEQFDIVIANPPYIRHEKIAYKASLLDSNYKVFTGIADLYTYFYELGLKLLKDGGILSFITSNKWMRAAYGKKLRKILAQDSTIKLLVDFKGFQVFEATVDTNVIILQNQKANNKHTFCYLNIPDDYQGENLDGYVKDKEKMDKIKQSILSEAGWTLEDDKTLNLKQKLEQKGKALKNWDISINYGIKTGCNPAFIIDTNTKEKLCNEDPKSIEIIKPMLRGRNISTYSHEWEGEWVIGTFPALGIDIDDYPAIKAYLQRFGKRLEQSGAKGSRKRTNNMWFETQDQIAYWKDFEKSKIIYPEIAQTCSFSYDIDSYFTNNKAFLITGKDLIPLLGILNSSLLEWYFRLINASLGKDGMEFRKIYVETVPIPAFKDHPQLKEAITDKVQSILSMDAELSSSSLYQETLVQIDELVYQLYELTAEEIALVEQASK